MLLPREYVSSASAMRHFLLLSSFLFAPDAVTLTLYEAQAAA